MDYRGIPLFLLLVQINWETGSFLSMLSQGQILVLNAGHSVSLDCEFYTEYFNLFDNPILWKKTQRNETLRMNIMGNMKAPFVDTERFDVAFQRMHPRYKFTLEISRLSLEDSGNYTCEVRGPRSSLQGLVTHRIFVRVPVETVYLTDDNVTTDVDGPYHGPLVFTEFRPSTVRCSSVGGYPPPDLDMYIGDHHLKNNFHIRHTATLTGSPGLRIMLYTTERWSHHFRAEARDDGAILKCFVNVEGFGVNVTTSPVIVHYAPVIKCDPRTAYIHEKNIFLRCEVKARPGVTLLYWTIGNGTTVAPGQVIQEMWTLTMDKGHFLEAKLFMREVGEEHFRKYTLTAENSVSATSETTHLVQKYIEPKRPRSSTTNSLKYNAQADTGPKILKTGTGYRIVSGSAQIYINNILLTVLLLLCYLLKHPELCR